VTRPAGERHCLELAGLKVATLAQVSKAKAIISPATSKTKLASGYPGSRETWLQLRANACPLTSFGTNPFHEEKAEIILAFQCFSFQLFLLTVSAR
jgi:hypothetical protein